MIHQIGFEEAKTNLLDLIEAAIKGEQVFIKKAGNNPYKNG